MLYKINHRVIFQKRNKIELGFLCIALQVIARSMHAKFGVKFGPMVTKFCSGEGYPDDAAAAATADAAADQNNPYLSHLQATQQSNIILQ